jgi:hypothetical protein
MISAPTADHAYMLQYIVTGNDKDNKKSQYNNNDAVTLLLFRMMVLRDLEIWFDCSS